MVSSLLHGGGVPDAVLQPGALHYLGRVVEAQAQTMGFQDGFMVIAVVFILALIPAMILAVKKVGVSAIPPPLSGGHERFNFRFG